MPVVFPLRQLTFTRPVNYYIPCGTGFDVMRFTVDFKILPGKELKQLDEQFTKGEIKQEQVLDAVIHNWHGLKDEASNAVPYSIAERKATEETWIGFEQAIAVAWFDAVNPHQRQAAVLAEEAAKNSEEPSSTTTV